MSDTEDRSLEANVPSKAPTSRSNTKRLNSLKSKKLQPEPEVQEEEEQRILYPSDRTVDHHLWQLNPTEMVKDAGYKGSAMLQEIMHQHFFHNITSNGEPKDVCSPCGGHYHKVTLTPSKKPGMAPKIKVGPAYQLQQKKVGNNFKTFEAPLVFIDGNGDELIDDHTHTATYQGSQKVNVRTVNPEAIKVQVQAEAAGRSIPGVVG